MGSISRGFSVLDTLGYLRAFERGQEDGFDFVEFNMNKFPRTLFDADAATVRDVAAEHELEIVAHLPFADDDYAVASSDEEVRNAAVEEMNEWVRLSGAVDAEKAVLHLESSSESPHLIDTGEIDRLVEAYREVESVARDHGIELCVENRHGGPPRFTDLPLLVERADLSLTIDTGHARVTGHSDEDIAAFVERYADQISHFHLNDTRGPSDEHLPFGAGTTDFAAILGALPDSWEGTMTLEVNTHDYDYIELSGRKLDALLDR